MQEVFKTSMQCVYVIAGGDLAGGRETNRSVQFVAELAGRREKFRGAVCAWRCLFRGMWSGLLCRMGDGEVDALRQRR
jgi:hypothetical protein